MFRDIGIYNSFIRHDAIEGLPIPEGFQDFVFSTIIYWLADTQAAPQEISRVLKPGGVLAFSCPDTNVTRHALVAIMRP
jgi:ubiquinone/menaquinone biosynthesis C-methylase UbiE